MKAPARDDDELIARHFEGDAALFAAFRAASVAQFGADLARGNAALAAGERAVLRRIAHDVKTVLGLLGDEVGATSARALEAAAQGEGALDAPWAALRRHLAAFQ